MPTSEAITGQPIPAAESIKIIFEFNFLLISSEYNSLPNIFKKRNEIISRIIELAESNNDIILYAD